ncbi:tRNA dihydrouridine synthase DusB [Alsobacter sp. R-9]
MQYPPEPAGRRDTGSAPALLIGDVPIDGRAFLAPMSGVTDAGMRRIARRFGASLVVSEMVASDELVKGSAEARLRAEGEGIDPHVVQLAGCDPAWMAEAARVAEGAGAAIIDINMGCPAKKVTGGMAGSALMRDLDHALSLIEATVAATSRPVTVKMRLGWDENSLNAPELARRAEAAGVKLVTVHGRTRCQFYKGQADWSAVRRVREATRLPLVVNGDGSSLADARAMLAASGADAVMIGRAATGRPWLVGAIARGLRGGAAAADEPDFGLRAAAAAEHYESLLSAYGIDVGVRHARKHLAAYADDAAASGLAVPEALRRMLVTSVAPREVLDGLARLYDPSRRELAA